MENTAALPDSVIGGLVGFDGDSSDESSEEEKK